MSAAEEDTDDTLRRERRPPEPGRRPGPRLVRGGALAVCIGVAAVGATLLLAAVAPTAEEGNPTVEVVTQVLLVLAVGTGVVVLLLRRCSPDVGGALVALLTGLFLCGGAAIILNATPFAPYGALADQGYRTAALTKFAHSWELVDYAYKDLPSFYPPLYFWVLGRLSALLGVPAWEMLKTGTLMVAFLVPVGGWFLWRPVVGPRRAAAVILVTSLVFQQWYVPHLWLAIAVFVPWWLRYVLGVVWPDDHPGGVDRPGGRRLTPGQVVTGILLGSVVALTYWYVLAMGLLQLVALLGLRRAFRRHGRPPEPASLRDVGLVLGGVAAVTIPYWLPLALRVLTTPGARTMQNRYFTADEVQLPLPFLDFDLQGMVLLFGLAALALTAHRSRCSLHLLGLVAAAYALYLLGYLGFLADLPLDTVRTRGLVELCLGAGAALGAVECWRGVGRLAAGTDRIGIDRTSIRTALVVGALVVVAALGQTAVRTIPYVREQRAARYPKALIDGFVRATRGDYEDAVVLTDVPDLSTFLPTYVFNTSNAHYSHPAALFTARADLLTRLGRERDREVFELALLHNRYDAIDLVALRAIGPDLVYTWLGDAFPEGVEQHSVTFPASMFTGAAFDALRGSQLEMFRVDRARDPLRELRACPDQPRRTECAVLGPLLARYGDHLDDEARELAERWRSARR